MKKSFDLVSSYKPSGDQPHAIEALVKGLYDGKRDQVLLGATGTGKTFTMANIIARTQRPALIMAHNKTLAAQLYGEMKSFFPNNAVEYFVSYYDYYQPEAYIPRTDVFIEKDSQINEQIDLMRHSATRALLEREDVIVVASVSCIYGLGSPEWYMKMTFALSVGQKIVRNDLLEQLINLQYKRNDIDFSRGAFRVRGDVVDIFPSHYQDRAWRIVFFGADIEEIVEFDPLTGEKILKLDSIQVFANTHYITPRPTLEQAMHLIKQEAKQRVKFFEEQGRFVEAQRISQRTQFDLEMMMESGSCKGIENYSRYLSGKDEGQPPPTLFEYLKKDALLFMDESHVSVPQVAGMYNGDRARKTTLVEYGFRLPSALDNRPLKFEEWDMMRSQTIFVSATPGKIELGLSNGLYVEQIIRPTGLLDPICIIRSASLQVDDLIKESNLAIASGDKVLVTTLTKKMAEDLSQYMTEVGIKAVYLHSDVKTLERIEIISQLRSGVFDVLIGVNLLREGLDIPECALVAILDADKEGFLRSKTSLIQTIGRAARNVNGRVLLYADKMTDSLKYALEETKRRREVQMHYNAKNGITPQSILKDCAKIINMKEEQQEHILVENVDKTIKELRKKMLQHANKQEFEEAAKIRDMLSRLALKVEG